MHVTARAADHQAGVNARTLPQGLIGVFLQRMRASPSNAFVGGDDHPAVGVEDPVAQRIRGKTAEHHRMHGTDASASQHGVGGLGDHGHVDTHPISLFDPPLPQYVGETTNLIVELAVTDVLMVVGLVPFPDQGRGIPPFCQVTIDTVHRHIEPTAAEPACPALVEIRFADLVPGAIPGQEAFRLLGPECFRLLQGAPIHLAIGVGIDQRGLLPRFRHRVKAGLAHRLPPVAA